MEERNGSKTNSSSKNPDISFINLAFPTPMVDSFKFFVPMGVLYLASYLEQKGFHPEILDYQLSGVDDFYSPEALLDFFRKSRSGVVGIGVMAKGLPMALIAAGMLKKEDPSRIIIMGGAGPTGNARGLMEKFPHIDYVIMGEGEETLGDLMEALKDDGNLSKINGLVWRDGGEVIQNPKRERIREPDSLPYPAYHLVDLAKYDYIYITGSRGCRHFCAFCDQPALWQGVETKRPARSIVEEIDFVKNKLKSDLDISFSDNEFLHDPDRFEEFAGELTRKEFKFQFGMERRIDTIDEDFLKKAKKIGCNALFFGIESGSANVLKEIRKGFTPDTIIPSLLLAARYIRTNVASFIFNYPFETLRDFLDTINIIYSLSRKKTKNLILFQLHYLSPLARTPILAKYRDRLIRRNVSNLMTSKDNRITYNVISNEDKNKILFLPKCMMGEIDEDERVTEMVGESPDLFPPYYVYTSPHLELKEKTIEAIKIAAHQKMKNLFFLWGEYLVYLGEDFVTVAGRKEDPDIPAALLVVSVDELEDPELVFLEIGKFPGKHYLISIDLSRLPEGTSTGESVINLLTKIREKGIEFTLLSHIPREYSSFTTHAKLISNFYMPKNPIDASDLFYVNRFGKVQTPAGKRGGHIYSYKSRESIFIELYGNYSHLKK